jgi:hypothetical protein
VVVTGEKVLIRDRQDIWYLIAWPVEGEPKLEGWINGNGFLVLPEGQSP